MEHGCHPHSSTNLVTCSIFGFQYTNTKGVNPKKRMEMGANTAINFILYATTSGKKCQDEHLRSLIVTLTQLEHMVAGFALTII